MTDDKERREWARVLRNWKEERDSAALYEALAQIEGNPRLRRVFGKLAASEHEHASYWEQRLRSQGRPVPRFRPSARTRIMAELARRFGVAFVIPSITVRELADQEKYSRQEDARQAGLMKGERGHAAVMRRIGIYGLVPGDDSATASEGAAGTSAPSTLGNNLRAAVLGANDGLVSNFCLMVGVAAGGMQAPGLLLTGVAGLVAGACSMALGEWLSVTNAREMAGSQIDRGVLELHATAGWKREELALMYEAKGMEEEDAKRAADETLARDPRAVEMLIGEELVLDVAAMGNDPMRAAGYSAALFALGALVPLLPYFLTSAARGLIVSVCLSLLALFTIGLLTAFFNGRSPLFSALRQVGVGILAAAVTYGAGSMVGAAIR
jgi:vacuolar iron transporter family protein